MVENNDEVPANDDRHWVRHLNRRLREEAFAVIRKSVHNIVDFDSGDEESNTTTGSVTVNCSDGTNSGTFTEGKPALCPQIWDSIICWPPTPVGSTAFVRCFEDFNGVKYDTKGNASKICFENGTWSNYSNFDECQPLEPDHEFDSSTILLTSTLYYIGYSISLIALLIAMWVFLYFKDLRCLRNTIHTNLMFTYVMANLMWILTSIWQDSLETGVTSCVILFLVLTYFHITTFFWMFVEGLYLYILVVETFNRKNINVKVYMCIGWGLPGIIITIWGVTRALAPARQEEVSNPLFIISCHWMSATLYDWIFKVPILTVMALNSIFLVLIMWVLITKLRAANNAETQQYRKAAKALMVLIPLLGITYILTIVSFKDGSIFSKAFYCLRAFMISSQGLLVAFFFCFLNSEVQNTVRHHMESWRTARNLGDRRYTYSKDWSPRSRTESIRLYSQPAINPYRKRESCASEVTTTTMIAVPNAMNRLSNGSANVGKLTTPFLTITPENEV